MAVQKVKRRGKEVWRARVRLGRRTLTAFRKYKRDAEEAEAELRVRIKREEDERACGFEKTPTLAEFGEEFLAYSDRENGRAEARSKRQHFRDHLLPVFGDLALDQITTARIDRFKARKLSTLAPATVARLVATLRRTLVVAHEWGALETVPKIKQVRQKAADFDYLSFEECSAYLEAAPVRWRPFLLVAVRTGLRQGELRGLQWGDVDLDGRRLRIARAFTQTGWETPKSGKGRTVDLAAEVVEVLGDLRPSKATRTALVFPGPSGGPLDEKAIYKACRAASEVAGLGRVLSAHKLRHTFASHHAMRGTPLPVLQAWLGHADIGTTMRYAHLCPSTSARFADNVAGESGVTTGVTKKKKRRS